MTLLTLFLFRTFALCLFPFYFGFIFISLVFRFLFLFLFCFPLFNKHLFLPSVVFLTLFLLHSTIVPCIFAIYSIHKRNVRHRSRIVSLIYNLPLCPQSLLYCLAIDVIQFSSRPCTKNRDRLTPFDSRYSMIFRQLL